MANEHVRQSVKEAFAKMDASGDGKVTFSEFHSFCSSVPGMENVAQVFNNCDTTGDFMVDEAELLEMMTKVPPKDIRDCHVRDLFKKVDTSGDGVLSKSEFRQFMLSLGYSGDCLENTIAAVVGDDDTVTLEEFIAQWKEDHN